MSVSEKSLHIDIPVKLTDVKVVFSIAALAFEGDLPASIFHLQLIRGDTAGWNAKAQIIAVFHTNAGHVTLNDHAYNTDRNIEILSSLLSLCDVTHPRNHAHASQDGDLDRARGSWRQHVQHSQRDGRNDTCSQ
jgi:hypothetical protein